MLYKDTFHASWRIKTGICLCAVSSKLLLRFGSRLIGRTDSTSVSIIWNFSPFPHGEEHNYGKDITKVKNIFIPQMCVFPVFWMSSCPYGCLGGFKLHYSIALSLDKNFVIDGRRKFWNFPPQKNNCGYYGQSKEVTGSLLFVFKFLSGELPGCWTSSSWRPFSSLRVSCCLCSLVTKERETGDGID